MTTIESNRLRIELRELDSIVDGDLVSLRGSLERLDELIRTDKTARGSIDDEFYSVLLRALTQISASNPPRWLELSLVVKCLKNSAGVFRERLPKSERLICTLLLDKLQFDQLEHDAIDANNNNFKFNFYLYLFQYIFNLIQGRYYGDLFSLYSFVFFILRIEFEI